MSNGAQYVPRFLCIAKIRLPPAPLHDVKHIPHQDSDITTARRFSVAPMMDWTDRHDRYFLRQISSRAFLYTEMVTTGALLHGDTKRFLDFHEAEHPVALQLGGCEPDALARCAVLAQEYHYDEVNLNVGCPSDRVQAARFGACLMAEPALVADCISAMRNACDIPVTVKCRIGIDDLDSYDHFKRFVETVADTGNDVFIVHARKAWLQGLSPKQNREIPPLQYELVYQLKNEFPELEIIINGGIENLQDAAMHLEHVDGVMLGRAAYKNPYLLSEVDRIFYKESAPAVTREEIVQRMFPYIEAAMNSGVPLKSITRHMLGLYHGQYGGKQWRRHLSENSYQDAAGLQTLTDALELVQSPSDRAA